MEYIGRGGATNLAELISWPIHLPATLRRMQRGDLFVGCARAQQGLHVVLLDGKQAIAQLAIGGQAQSGCSSGRTGGSRTR